MARRERGAAAVEMAIVLPLLLLMVGGIIDFGRAFYTQIVISNAAREGARMLAMGYDVSATTARANAAAQPVVLGGVTVTSSISQACPTPLPEPPAPPAIGEMTVTVNGFEWMLLDVVPSMFGGTVPTPKLSSKGSMRCGG